MVCLPLSVLSPLTSPPTMSIDFVTQRIPLFSRQQSPLSLLPNSIHSNYWQTLTNNPKRKSWQRKFNNILNKIPIYPKHWLETFYLQMLEWNDWMKISRVSETNRVRLKHQQTLLVWMNSNIIGKLITLMEAKQHCDSVWATDRFGRTSAAAPQRRQQLLKQTGASEGARERRK